MKQIFNRLVILIVTVLASTATVSAQAWVDKLINHYKNRDGVEKQISINRDPETHKVVRENYIFNFSAAKEYNYVKSELVKHADDADYFHMVDEKGPRVTLRRSDDDHRTTVDIVKNGKSYRLTINRIDEANERAAEATRLAQAEARQAQRQAQEEARQAHRQAQEQACQALQQARQAQRLAQEQAKEARRQTQRLQSTGQTKTTVVRADSAANTAAVAAQRELLRQAKARRQK